MVDVTLRKPLLIALMLEMLRLGGAWRRVKKDGETSCNSRQRKKIWSSMTTSINDATVSSIASLASHGESRSETHQQEETNIVNPNCSEEANDAI